MSKNSSQTTIHCFQQWLNSVFAPKGPKKQNVGGDDFIFNVKKHSK